MTPRSPPTAAWTATWSATWSPTNAPYVTRASGPACCAKSTWGRSTMWRSRVRLMEFVLYKTSREVSVYIWVNVQPKTTVILLQLSVWTVKMVGRRERRRKMKMGKSRQSGRAWKSSPSRRNRRPSSQRTLERRPHCQSESSPSRLPRGIGSARSRTRPWS